MTPHLDPNHYQLLKKRVLHEANIKDIVPSDCRFLSLVIFNKIKRRISETTLKRIYGFAHAEFKPSLFTINALANFCGFDDWLSFRKELIPALAITANDKRRWRKTLEQANETTRTTLQVLKNKCGIPYERTITRSFLSHHFDAFFKEEAAATVLLAPAGHGKTIALCHWLDDFIRQNNSLGQQDIILFFSGSALVNAYESGHNLNNWLLALLGLDPNNFLSYLFVPDSGFNGWFYLIIDGLDEVYYKGHLFATIFEQLNDIIVLHSKTYRLKIVTTMRSATWSNNIHHITEQKHWFTGFLINCNRSINVPMLDKHELATLAQKADPAFRGEISERGVKLLGLPLFFQYYYRMENRMHNIAQFNEVDEFNVISVYVLSKIYKNKHSVEMVTFIREFLSFLEQEDKINNVSKLKAAQLVKTYHNGYEELLNIGYLVNLNDSNNTLLENRIRFSMPALMDHSFSKKIYFDNNEAFNEQLLEVIKAKPITEARQVTALKWCIYLTIMNGKHVDLVLLTGFETNLSHRLDLINFVTTLLRDADGKVSKSSILSGDTSDYFIGLEYANVAYEKALNTLLSLNLTVREKILIKCSLCVIAILELDINRLETHLNELRIYFSESLESFLIDPLPCLSNIYTFLKYGVMNKDTIADITRFYFHPPLTISNSEKNSFNEVLFTLGLNTLSICNNPKKTIRFVNALNKVYRSGSNAYKFLLGVSLTDALFDAGNIAKGNNEFWMLTDWFEKEQVGFTPIMKVYYLALKIKATVLEDEMTDLTTQIKSFIKLCEENSYKIIKVRTLAFVLGGFAPTRGVYNIFDDLYFDMIRTMRTSGCRVESFYTEKKTF